VSFVVNAFTEVYRCPIIFANASPTILQYEGALKSWRRQQHHRKRHIRPAIRFPMPISTRLRSGEKNSAAAQEKFVVAPSRQHHDSGSWSAFAKREENGRGRQKRNCTGIDTTGGLPFETAGK